MGTELNAVSSVPEPRNEPALSFIPGSPERVALDSALDSTSAGGQLVASIIDNTTVESGDTFTLVQPHCHEKVLALAHRASRAQIGDAVESALRAKDAWSRMPFDERAAIYLRAAELLSGPYRAEINAATMLGQSKTCQQAEIDAACEMIDFLRFNVAFARSVLDWQPRSSPGVWNRSDYRALDGFVLAISPFNFTSIAGNLSSAPALMGNTVLWKPASTAALSAQVLMRVFIEAGLPKGVINLVHASGPDISAIALPHRALAGVHFTGSTATFRALWSGVGSTIDHYIGYPRLVGETGGKDFIVAHTSAAIDRLLVALLQGAFEYQGQKCSAVSRAYIPRSIWPTVRDRLVDEIASLPMGDVRDYSNFMGAVINEASFDNIAAALKRADADDSATILCGGPGSKEVGYFVPPTVVVVDDPTHDLMREELFGPVLTVYVYADDKFDETLKLCDATSPYALTGAVFANDRAAIIQAMDALRSAAGNFYINDKPTGAVVGQQPFGGGRASGTNDKAGSVLNLLRWTSPRSIKENLNAPTTWRHPHMA